VEYSYFPLHPETPVEGRLLTDLFAGREALFTSMSERLREVMALEGLEYHDRTHTYRSRLAQEMAVWADTLGATDRFHGALFHAYFVEGLNLAQPDVLFAAAESAGLDAGEAREVVAERRFAGVVDDHWRSAMESGVSGVPTFLIGGFGVVGARPYEVLEALLARCGVRRRRQPP
jgi:predicted DsbA family dithiol-disulfide isomerase